jgi:hypothetical protein
MVGPYGCITFSCWLALNAPAPGDDADANARQVKAFVTKSFKEIWPAPEYMRLYVEPNGQCNDIEDLPMITLVRFGTLPHRRNGPVDVHGSYGPDDCTIVAINGAVGHAFLSRALLVEHDPLYAEGGIVLWDEQLRAIINSKSPYDLQPRVGLANSYAVFAKTQGIFLVATELHLRDGTMTLHTIYVDMWRRVVHFGLNDGGTDMISFLIERADERDCETARDNLVNEKNFPVDPQRPDKKLVRPRVVAGRVELLGAGGQAHGREVVWWVGEQRTTRLLSAHARAHARCTELARGNLTELARGNLMIWRQ